MARKSLYLTHELSSESTSSWMQGCRRSSSILFVDRTVTVAMLIIYFLSIRDCPYNHLETITMVTISLLLPQMCFYYCYCHYRCCYYYCTCYSIVPRDRRMPIQYNCYFINIFVFRPFQVENVLLCCCVEIPFLDVCIKRDHNTFSTTIHHKKTFTGLYTKWDSFTPRKYKVNLIRTLTYRCLRICSKSTLLQSALSDLKNSLLQNGYPKGVINYNVNDLLHKHKNKPSKPTLTVPKKDVTLVLPYLGLHSDAVARRLKSCVNKFYGFVNLRVVFQNTRRIKSFFPYKDRFNRSQKSKIVYIASCWDCDAFYIGKTKRRLHDRKTEHYKALTQIGHASAVAEHSIFTGHNIKWDHFEILAGGQCDLQCKIKETLLIRDLKPALNENVGSENLLLY